MSLFPVAIITLFWKFDLGMSLEEILLLQAAYSGMVACMEFPAGYIGDRIGYRKSLILGFSIATIGYGAYTQATSFYHALLAELTIGLGMTFVSGCDLALMFETLKAEAKVRTYTLWNSRWVSVGQAAEGIAALSAGLLYSVWAEGPFYLQTAVYVIAVILAFKLKEPPATAARKPHSHLREVVGILKSTFVTTPVLRWTLLLSCTFGLASYFPVWIVQLYSNDAGLPVAWLGVTWAIANFMVAFGAHMGHKLENHFSSAQILTGCILLMAAGYFGLSLSHSLFGFAFYFLITLSRGINAPFLTAKVQFLIDSEHRASVLSLRSLVIRGFFATTAPLVGIYLEANGYHAGFALVGGVLVLAMFLFLWLSSKKRPVETTLSSTGV